MRVIIVRQLEDQWITYMQDDPDCCEYGDTKFEALGYLLVNIASTLNVSIVKQT